MTVVEVFELRRWDAAEVVEDGAVVEPVDPFEGGEFEVVEAAPGAFVADKFGLVEAVDGLGERIVVAVADAADRGLDPGLGQALEADPAFQSLDALDRVDALRRARQASCLMLVQHADERSRETIPYKTYDYLNLGLPVFGLLNNDELQALIESCGGHAAQADNVEAIKCTLRACLSDLVAERTAQNETACRLDITRQFLQVLECADGGR